MPKNATQPVVTAGAPEYTLKHWHYCCTQFDRRFKALVGAALSLNTVASALAIDNGQVEEVEARLLS